MKLARDKEREIALNKNHKIMQNKMLATDIWIE